MIKALRDAVAAQFATVAAAHAPGFTAGRDIYHERQAEGGPFLTLQSAGFPNSEPALVDPMVGTLGGGWQVDFLIEAQLVSEDRDTRDTLLLQAQRAADELVKRPYPHASIMFMQIAPEGSRRADTADNSTQTIADLLIPIRVDVYADSLSEG